MSEYNIGEIIKSERLHRKFTQVELSTGICDPQSVSRLERGVQFPHDCILRALMERLGLAVDEYYRLSNFEKFEIEELKQQIRDLNAKEEYEHAIELTTRLQQDYDCTDNILMQFILWMNTINGRLIDGKLVPYENADRLKRLKEAVNVTVPGFDENNIENLCLEYDAIRIIIAVANTYSQMKDYQAAINIYSQLLRYVEKKIYPLAEARKLFLF